MKDQKQEGAPSSESTSHEQPAAPHTEQQPGQAGAKPFNPLAGAADVKATRPVVVTTTELEQPIPEPAYEVPPISSEPNPLDQNSGQQQQPQHSQPSGPGPYPQGEGAFKPGGDGNFGYQPGQQQGQQQRRPAEPKKPLVLPMEDLTPQERSLAAENMAKLAMTGYKTLHKAANAALKVSEFKQTRLARKGELDLATPVVPTRSGGKVSIGEFLHEYNDGCKDTFVVDQDFEDEVMPVLTRVLQKHGIGLTDEQHLMALVGQDFGYKLVGQFIPLMRQRTIMMDSFKDLTKALREGAQIVATPVTHTPPPAPPPQQEQYYAPPPQQQPQPQQPAYDNSAQRDALDEYTMHQQSQGSHAMGAAVESHVQRKWNNKELLKRASNISKRLNKDKPQPAAKKKKR